jgi:hypothetical protein
VQSTLGFSTGEALSENPLESGIWVTGTDALSLDAPFSHPADIF